MAANVVSTVCVKKVSKRGRWLGVGARYHALWLWQTPMASIAISSISNAKQPLHVGVASFV